MSEGRTMPIGLTDKLYWRRVGAVYHCFRGLRGGGYASLCGGHLRERSGGQAINRPEPLERCGRCDGLEMSRRGVTESMPARQANAGRYA